MKLVILTGAGISAESGLGTFRDKGGLWDQYPLEEVATPQGYARDPNKVLDFYTLRRVNACGASPNAAHEALARLENADGIALTLITQNIDDLHERGGSARVHHIHGSLFETACTRCGSVFEDRKELAVDFSCPECHATGTLRPNVVWFGEIPYGLDEAAEAIMTCDLFVSIGTSGTVYPAAGFVELAREAGAETLELNLEASGNSAFQRVVTGPATQIVPQWVDSLISS